MISAANLHLLFLDADGFYLDEFVFQSLLSLTCGTLAVRPRFMRIKRPADGGATCKRAATGIGWAVERSVCVTMTLCYGDSVAVIWEAMWTDLAQGICSVNREGGSMRWRMAASVPRDVLRQIAMS